MDNYPPKRIFLDTSTLQTLQDYGEFIYDGAQLEQDDRIISIPDGFENIVALRSIVSVNRRGAFEFAISTNTLREVEDRNSLTFLQWAYEIRDYWDKCIENAKESASGQPNSQLAAAEAIQHSRYNYLSAKDRLLIQDALSLGCDAFLTMERKLPRNAEHLERSLAIKIVTPIRLWEMIEPWADLF